MASMNQIILIGKVSTIGTLKNNELHILLGIPRPRTVDRRNYDENGKPIVDDVRCRLYDKQAEIFTDYASVGTMISITGSLRIETIGQTQSYYIACENFQFLAAPGAKSGKGQVA